MELPEKALIPVPFREGAGGSPVCCLAAGTCKRGKRLRIYQAAVLDVNQQIVRTKEIRAEEGKGDVGRDKIPLESLASKAQVRSLYAIRVDGGVVSECSSIDVLPLVAVRGRV